MPATITATDVAPARPLGSGDAGKGPKRPPNAYALFVKDQYCAVLRRLPECSHDMASVSRALAAAWRRLPDAERNSYRERAEALLRAFYERRQELYASAPVATEAALHRLSTDLSLAEKSLAEVQAQMLELLANYHRLGADVEFLEAQLWNQAGVLRAAVQGEVKYRIQQLTADNAKLWLFAVTQHQNAVACAQALQACAQVAQLQLEVRSLRAAVSAAESAKPRTAARVLLMSVTTAVALLTGVLVMAVLPGASNALKTGVAAGSQMPLQQPYTAPPTLVVGVLIAAAAVAQLCASAFAAKADS